MTTAIRINRNIIIKSAVTPAFKVFIKLIESSEMTAKRDLILLS